jgi:2',3'-cyclic-nucleotide 2'-phosphodiesterase (5'-nucleotidase family)
VEVAKTEIIMTSIEKILFFASLLCVLSLSSGAQEHSMTWKRVFMDESRTGTQLSSKDNVQKALGSVKGNKYYAPNGKVYKGGCTAKVAKVVLDAQPAMADVKVVVGYSTQEMHSHAPESALSNWFVDELMRFVSEKTGKQMDLGVANFGGIRVDMPQGDILADDIISMFPFRNNVCYLELKGADVRHILEQMAATKVQALGGVRCVIKDHKLVSATFGGEPIDDAKIYNVATISFLLDGGDDLFIAKNAVSLKIFPEYILDVMLPYVKSLTAAGKPVEYQADGRVTDH